MLTPWKTRYDQPRQHVKKQRHYFANKVSSSQSYGFSSSHVWMWELDYKESWALKNGCFRTLSLEKTLESPLDCKEIQLVNPKGNQSWMFTWRTDAEAETPILWPPDVKNWLTGKNTDSGKDWKWEKKGTTEDEMVGWHHQPDGHEFEQDLGVGNGKGRLACCSPWDCKELNTTEQLNWTELNWLLDFEIFCNILANDFSFWLWVFWVPCLTLLFFPRPYVFPEVWSVLHKGRIDCNLSFNFHNKAIEVFIIIFDLLEAETFSSETLNNLP